ncbi:unnamed protein product [Dracunculus medinensis]|uniref:RNA 3'-terminal phosphate cyclase-like protein n=1 Tax=Dracunculus medinensis TaxID=318479 RepID=A0A0N4U2R1_DRAME|nr:unnamed protein product [Dracunculus medinensis]
MEIKEELNYEGCNFFRLRLVYSVLSGRPIRIMKIRANSDEPGLKSFELNFLSLLENITNGTRLEISKTGFEDLYLSMFFSYYLEPLLMIAPFCKHPLRIQLNGVTNTPDELSVDTIRASWLPVFRKFVPTDEQLDIKNHLLKLEKIFQIISRGLKPDGGGTIIFTAPIVRVLRPVQCEKMGKICKIRGIAYVCKVSPSLAHRMIESAKRALYGFIADVYITLDQRKGTNGGNSPGYGIIITAETTEGVVFHGEAASKPKGESGEPIIPEDIGTLAANNLLNEIYSVHTSQALASTFMALVDKDVSKFLFGPLSNYCIHCLRHLKHFFGIIFKIDDWWMLKKEQKKSSGSDEKAFLTCVGIGYSNLNKTIL